MRHETIICDFCNLDITVSSGARSFRIFLASQSIPHAGGIVLDVAIPDPLPQDKHFCSMKCLKEWIYK